MLNQKITLAAFAAVLGAIGVAGQAGFSSLPYSFITPYNHSCAFKNPGRSCPEANPMQVRYTRPGFECGLMKSCSQVDSCCQETFGGLVLSTQFWSTYTGRESSGQLLPQNSWSTLIQGLPVIFAVLIGVLLSQLYTDYGRYVHMFAHSDTFLNRVDGSQDFCNGTQALFAYFLHR